MDDDRADTAGDVERSDILPDGRSRLRGRPSLLLRVGDALCDEALDLPGLPRGSGADTGRDVGVGVAPLEEEPLVAAGRVLPFLTGSLPGRAQRLADRLLELPRRPFGVG